MTERDYQNQIIDAVHSNNQVAIAELAHHLKRAETTAPTATGAALQSVPLTPIELTQAQFTAAFHRWNVDGCENEHYTEEQQAQYNQKCNTDAIAWCESLWQFIQNEKNKRKT